MKHSSLDHIFEAHIQTLALTLRPGTITHYRCLARQFLPYLHTAFPEVCQLSQLRRDPHLLGWFRSLCERKPPLRNQTRSGYLLCLRRLLDDLAANGHSIQPNLIHREDFPPLEQYLPRPLSLADDRRLQRQLRRTDDLLSNALLLTRLSGIRSGECVALRLDCLHQIGPNQWALHVPIGKLHTERFVPADLPIRQTVARILALRALASPARLARSEGLLLPRLRTPHAVYEALSRALADNAQRAGCSGPVSLHRLRHTFASEMIRLGVGLPALMQLLGHKDIRMTLRYVQVTQPDLQREFHSARRRVHPAHQVPALSVPTSLHNAGLPGIHQALTATRHLLEMYRREVSDEKSRRRIRRLDSRLAKIAAQLTHITTPADK
jgi:site-specific recombinase XerD